MKVLLIKPETVGIFSYTNLVDHEPLELEYLYTALEKHGHDACIYDRRHDLTPLSSKLKRFQPDVVCITGYITQEKLMRKLTRQVKGFNGEITVIIGGPHAEMNYRNFFPSRADYIYHLSGLDCFLQLIAYIENQRAPIARSEIAGICYRGGEGWQVADKVLQNPNNLPRVDKTYFNQHRARYRYLTFHPLALVKNAYSCPHSCRFCYCTNLNGGVYACRNVEDLVDEMREINAPNIHITDDNFLVDKQYLQRFIQLIREKGIDKKFLIYGRADFIAENRELLAELKKIGLSLVMVGLEARSNEELTAYNKHATVQHNEECVKILSELGIICAGLFIVHQDMTRKDFQELFQWITAREIVPTISIFTPMQGSADFSSYKDKLLTQDPAKQDLFHCILKPRHMSRVRFTYEYYKLSLQLFWHHRKHPLYACIGFGSFLFVLRATAMKLRRAILF